MELHKLAGESGLSLKVHHYPPGTLKWNKFEHRMFCHIPQNWRGQSLESRLAVVDLIGATTTKAGLTIECALDERTYEKGMRIKKAEMKLVDIKHTSKRTQVYLVRDTSTGQLAALKTPSVNFEDDPAYIEMFAREDWVGRLVDSPHVVKMLAAGRQRQHLYTLTEFFDAQTLRQWMRDNRRPDLETVRNIIEQIAKGLRAFHRKDILHLDLKPENILIDRNLMVKLIDFGSARAAGLEELASPVERQSLVGTLDYTAPEIHRGEAPTNRADIFALGAIAYEFLSEKLPFGRGFAGASDVARLSYVQICTLCDDVPLWVDAALRQAVMKRPAERTQALSALTQDLRHPNPSLGCDQPRSILERDPAGFWRAVAIGLLFVNLVLIAWLLR